MGIVTKGRADEVRQMRASASATCRLFGHSTWYRLMEPAPAILTTCFLAVYMCGHGTFVPHCLQADLEATAFNGRDRSEVISFLECLHCARRLHEKIGLGRDSQIGMFDILPSILRGSKRSDVVAPARSRRITDRKISKCCSCLPLKNVELLELPRRVAFVATPVFCFGTTSLAT